MIGPSSANLRETRHPHKSKTKFNQACENVREFPGRKVAYNAIFRPLKNEKLNEQFRSVAFLRFRKIISTNIYINSIRIERKFREKFDQFNISIESESIRAEKYKWFEKIKKKEKERIVEKQIPFPEQIEERGRRKVERMMI